MDQLTFTMLCGAPAAGKSTYAAQLRVDREDIAYICPDVIRGQLSPTGDEGDQTHNARIFQTILPSLVHSAASEGRDVILDGTFTTRKARAPFIELARSLGYRVECHVLNTPYEECVRRNAARSRVVPESVLFRMQSQWQMPSLEEDFDEICFPSMVLHAG